MSGLRLEKGYRDMGVDIDNTDNPLQAGLGFAVAWDKPGGFTGRAAAATITALSAVTWLRISAASAPLTKVLSGMTMTA